MHRRRRAGDPRRRDGRPLRPADHDRAAGRRRDRRPGPRRRRRDRRPPDDRAPRATTSPSSRKAGADSITIHAEADPARQPHPQRDPRGGLPRRARAQPRHAGRGGLRARRRRRPRPLHDGQPGLGRPAVHRRARPARSARLARARARGRCIEVDGGIDADDRGQRRRRRRDAVRRGLGDLRQARPGRGLRARSPAPPAPRSPSRSAARRCRGAQRAGELLPPGPLGRRESPGGRPGARTTRRGGGGRRPRAGRRRSPRSGRRRARPARRCRRGGFAAAAATGDALRSRCGRAGVAVLGSPRPHGEHLRRAARRQRRHGRLAERAVAPAPGELLRPRRAPRAGRRCGARRRPRSRSSRAAAAPRRRGRSG